MRRETIDTINVTTAEVAMVAALEHEAFSCHFDDSMEARASTVINHLEVLGFEVVRRPTEAAKPQRWVLAQVVPGVVRVRQNEDGNDVHDVRASATATVVRWGGRGPGGSREISVDTAWVATEDAVGAATSKAMALALQQARAAAEGFIEATEQALAAAA